jgi:hypothetical protein
MDPAQIRLNKYIISLQDFFPADMKVIKGTVQQDGFSQNAQLGAHHSDCAFGLHHTRIYNAL